jgi:hypothetical protein
VFVTTMPRALAAARLLTNPTSGIAGCWARVASGHAAAPPSSVINSRRPKKAVSDLLRLALDSTIAVALR